ncbi:unnamed protein product [Prorocentrum cordatum]|uniref:Uncharacterized protein n=1 Tax=Prorocentrum cordatum TaxID=2364126 RepID=A0ABN9UZE2_9DINO|nr:unnamed protein product [Polarella glacialis]
MGKAQKRLAAGAADGRGRYLAAEKIVQYQRSCTSSSPGPCCRSPLAIPGSCSPYGFSPRECGDSAGDSYAHPPTRGPINAVVHIAPSLGPARADHHGAPGVQESAAATSAARPQGPHRGPATAARGGPPGRWDGQARSSPDPLPAAPPGRLQAPAAPPSARQEHEAAGEHHAAAALGTPAARAPLAPPGSWRGTAWQASAPPGLEAARAPPASAAPGLPAPASGAPRLPPPGPGDGGARHGPWPAAIGLPPGLEASGSGPDRSEAQAPTARPPAVPPGSWDVGAAPPRSEPLAAEPPPPQRLEAPRQARRAWCPEGRDEAVLGRADQTEGGHGRTEAGSLAGLRGQTARLSWPAQRCEQREGGAA